MKTESHGATLLDKDYISVQDMSFMKTITHGAVCFERSKRIDTDSFQHIILPYNSTPAFEAREWMGSF